VNLPHSDVPTDAADLAEALDWMAIRRLQDLYADVVTRRAWDELDGVLAPECSLDLDLGDRELEVSGRTSIAEFIEGAVSRFDFFEFVILNSVVDVDRPPRDTRSALTARSRLWMVELRQDLATGKRSNAYGLYQDRLVKTPKGWRMTQRHYSSVSRTAGDDHPSDQIVFDIDVLDFDAM